MLAEAETGKNQQVTAVRTVVAPLKSGPLLRRATTNRRCVPRHIAQ